MDYDLKIKFEKFLIPDEYIVWCGQPDGKIHFSKIDIFLIPYSLFWIAFAYFFNCILWTNGLPFPLKFFGLPHIAISIYMLFGRFIYDIYKKKRTRYCLTNQRVLIAQKGGKLRSIYIQDIKNEDLTLKSSGVGTIVFGDVDIFKNLVTIAYLGQLYLTGFENIDNCQYVYDKYISVKHQIKTTTLQ